MDTAEKVQRKVRRGIFRIAEEVSRVFKTDVSVQPAVDADAGGGWVLGVVGIGEFRFVQDENVVAGSVVTSKATRKRKRRANRTGNRKRTNSSSSGVDATGC